MEFRNVRLLEKLENPKFVCDGLCLQHCFCLVCLSVCLSPPSLHPSPPSLRFYEAEKVVLVVFSLVGFLFFDMVYVATAMNHAVQSELLVWLVSSITTLIKNNQYHNIDAAIKVG